MATHKSDRFEGVFDLIGELGPFQLWNYTKLLLISIFAGMQIYANNVIIRQPNQNFTCACSPEINGQNQTSNKLINYNTDENIQSNEAFDSLNPCNFTDEDFRVSVVASFQLVCDREYLMRLPNFIFYFGNFAGSFFFGTISDYFGRRVAICSAIFVLFSSTATLAIPMGLHFEAFLILRFLAGGATLGLYLSAYVMAVEFMSSRWRTVGGIVPNMIFAIGPIITGIIAVFVDNWRQLCLLYSLPGLVFFPIVLSLPESLRWLLGKQKISKLKSTLRRAAKTNGKLKGEWAAAELDLLVDEIESEKKEKKENGTEANVLHLFKGRHTAGKSFVIFVNWMIVTGVFYGVTLNTVRMEISPILGVVLSGLAEFLAYVTQFRVLNFFGRKLYYTTTMMLGGVVCFSTIFVDGDVGAFALSMIGKIFLSAAFGALYIFSAELFPTVLRSTGIGTSSLTARVGSMAAPLLVDFAPDATTPLVVFGCLAAFAGLLALTLPETAGRPMPETPKEAELRRLESPLSICRRNPLRRHPAEGKGCVDDAEV